MNIEMLIQFAKEKGIFHEEDESFIRNSLLDLFDLDEPYTGDLPKVKVEAIQAILNPLLDEGYKAGLIPENTTTYRDLLEAKIMGIVLPRPSEVIKEFQKTASIKNIEQATDDFYKLSIDSNYIKMDRIAKNLYWRTLTGFGELEITINLSKPEKDPKEIEKLRDMPQSNYPKCLLCAENVGFRGNLNHPARQNHRIIPIHMANEKWYFQYSPYVYYNEHCIVLSANHTPMTMTWKTFERLLGFVEQIPHYFLGANAGLPVVGGSIMSHEHYQGGHHEFPMEIAPIQQKFSHRNYPGVNIGIVKWPLSVIRLSSENKEAVINLGADLLKTWEEYSNPTVEILAYTEENGEKTPHNTVTPIARKNKQGNYELDLTLRNNRRSAEHPEGIFHPHRDLHHIKKENIGLIEVMGLAVLPGRLSTELSLIADEIRKDKMEIAPDSELRKHEPWMMKIRAAHGKNMSREQAEEIIRYEVGQVFAKVLADAGVYKHTDAGKVAFLEFMNHAGCEKI